MKMKKKKSHNFFIQPYNIGREESDETRKERPSVCLRLLL